MEKILYHADDLGATIGVTRRILDTWQSGLLDGFSIFANSDNFKEIAEKLDANRNRKARIGVHLNLWEGHSILAPEKIPNLVDKEGYFKVDFLDVLKQYFKGSKTFREVLLAEVEGEWRAQIQRVQECIKPRSLSVIDSHIHIHMLPFFFNIAVSLAKEFGVAEIRIVREPFYLSSKLGDCLSPHFLSNFIKHCVLKCCSFFDTGVAKKAGMKYPGAMIGVLYSGMMNESNIKAGIRAAEKNGAKSLEVLMHIGRAAGDELGRWGKNTEKANFVVSIDRDQEYQELIRCRKAAMR